MAKLGRIERELAFQREAAAGTQRADAVHPTVLERYRRNRSWRTFPKEGAFHFLGDPRGAKVLDFGCGSGKNAVQLALLRATVTGIDVSPEQVAIARERARRNSVSDRTTFRVANGEEVDLPPAHFDRVLVYAALHHMAIAPALRIIRATLKRGGRAVLVEPVVLSKGLEVLRRHVPLATHASPDERQLRPADLREICAGFFPV